MNARVWIMLALLALPVAGRAADEWYVSYEKGVDAVRGGQWQEGVQLLTEAIGGRNEERARMKTYGLRFIDYFPYAYRGYAYSKLGQTARALEDLERSERDGQVFNASQDRNAGTMVRETLDLLRKSKTSDKTFADAVALYRQKEYARAIDLFRSIPAGSSSAGEAQRYIALAQAEMNAKPAAPPTTVPATTTRPTERRTSAQIAAEYQAGVRLFDRKEYDGAEAKFEAVLKYEPKHGGAQKYLGRIRNARAALASKPAGGTTSAPGKQPSGNETLFAQALDLFRNGRMESARRAFLTVRAADPSRTEVGTYLDSIDHTTERARTGIVAFCEGDYPAAITSLADAALVNGESPHVFGFLASAYAAQYFLTGGEDRALQRNAVEAFRRARQLDAAYALDGRIVSPRIVALLTTQ
jgi:tetratricopeptide (TPR) repeat protein